MGKGRSFNVEKNRTTLLEKANILLSRENLLLFEKTIMLHVLLRGQYYTVLGKSLLMLRGNSTILVREKPFVFPLRWKKVLHCCRNRSVFYHMGNSTELLGKIRVDSVERRCSMML